MGKGRRGERERRVEEGYGPLSQIPGNALGLGQDFHGT